jgi:hypothetical protein
MSLVTTRQLVFAASTPTAARKVLASLWELELPDREREFVAAIAEHPAMTEVWEKLPGKDKNAEIVIEKIFEATRLVFDKRPRPPMPKDEDGRREWFARYACPTLRGVEGLALWLREALEATAKQAEAQWPTNVPFEKFRDFVQHVEWIERVYGQMADEGERYWARLEYPQLRNTHSERTPKNAFSLMMTSFFERKFGAPFYEIVAAIETAVFKSDGASAETVKKRHQRRK